MLKEEGGAKFGNILYGRNECESREKKLRTEEIQKGLKQDVCVCFIPRSEQDDQAEAEAPESKRDDQAEAEEPEAKRSCR